MSTEIKLNTEIRKIISAKQRCSLVGANPEEVKLICASGIVHVL